ncbi:MAG TPA: hypothetical protein VFQ85_07370 [Mycobacteriales bacterium]|jgi:hypothetical protein|nr:hypothetical protein [Mycobacteriales bacterium]
MTTERALDVDDVELAWYGGGDVAVRIRDCALVEIYDIDFADGTARLRVYASLATDAPVIFDGQVDVHPRGAVVDER